MMNKGIIVSGGSLSADDIVVGDNASLSISSPDVLANRHAELVSRLEGLVVEVEKIRGSSEQYAALIDAATRAKCEGAKEKPNRDTLDAILSIIEKSASVFSGVAGAVVAVKGALAALFA
jgi:hypothetical protein